LRFLECRGSSPCAKPALLSIHLPLHRTALTACFPALPEALCFSFLPLLRMNVNTTDSHPPPLVPRTAPVRTEKAGKQNPIPCSHQRAEAGAPGRAAWQGSLLLLPGMMLVLVQHKSRDPRHSQQAPREDHRAEYQCSNT